MKKIMLIALVSIFSFMTVNAENEELNNIVTEQPTDVQEPIATSTVPEQQEEAKPIENELMLQYANLYACQSEASMPAVTNYDEGFRQDTKWKHARNLRNIGMILTIAGYIAEIPLAVHFSKQQKTVDGNSEIADAANVALGELGLLTGIGKAGVYCALPIFGGMAMWITGNCLMRKARMSYTGNGIAFNF